MQHTSPTPGTVWCTALVPGTYGKTLHIEAVGREDVSPDMLYQLREYTAQKTGSLTEWMAEEAHAGRTRHCQIDTHQCQPGIITVRGNLHDLEDLARYADNAVRPKGIPDPRTAARGGNLRLVARDGVILT